jgi:hypothetical protein
MVFMAAFAVMQASPVKAAVNMISVERRIWGNAGPATYDETDLWDDEFPIPYGGPGFTPLSESATENFNHASSTASDWSINAYASNFIPNEALAYAQNTYVFKPFSREILIFLNGVIGVWWFENAAKMELKNLTTTNPVSSYYSPSYFYPNNPFPPDENDMQNYPINWDMTVEVDPEHEYELILFVGASNSEGGSGLASLNLTIVPEPSATLLAGVAALFMCGRRHRTKAAR